MADGDTSLLQAASGISEEIVLSIEGIPPGFEIRADGIYEVAEGTDPPPVFAPGCHGGIRGSRRPQPWQGHFVRG